MSKICVSIAAKEVTQLNKQIKNAFKAGADYIEIRFDYLNNLDDIEKAIPTVRNIKKKAIFTLRSPYDNGKYRGTDTDRINFLKKLAAARPMLLDVELNTIKTYNNNNACNKENSNLINYFKKQKTRIMVSWHNFENTPTNSNLKKILKEMRQYSSYIKIVTTANEIEDCIRLLDLYKSTSGLTLVAFAMGEQGIISRLLCTLLKTKTAAPFTYAALEKAIAPGQLTIKQMRKLYDMVGNLQCSCTPKRLS